jgi:hypothetical protein
MFFLKNLREVLGKIKLSSPQRGRPPKHSREKYLELLLLKEFKKASLRGAEEDYSKEVCRERVDHSVIHYWEKNFDRRVIQRIIEKVGELLNRLIPPSFYVIDGTKFTSWRKRDVGTHCFTAISKETVYPRSVYLRNKFFPGQCEETIVPGQGKLYEDCWYDNEKVLKVEFLRGYTPVLKPREEYQWGKYRKKAREIWEKEKESYNERSRGESIFGSLTDLFGDRLKTIREDTSQLRVGLRYLVYQLRLLIRIKWKETSFLLQRFGVILFRVGRIIRHAPLCVAVLL